MELFTACAIRSRQSLPRQRLLVDRLECTGCGGGGRLCGGASGAGGGELEDVVQITPGAWAANSACYSSMVFPEKGGGRRGYIHVSLGRLGTTMPSRSAYTYV